jgi:head-tail adaptor
MAIGSMRERITIQAPNNLPNGQGGFKRDYKNPVVIGEYWAAYEFVSGIEAVKYGGQHSEDYIKFTTRQNSSIKKSYQLSWRGRLFEIDDIQLAKQLGYIIIYAKEVAG